MHQASGGRTEWTAGLFGVLGLRAVKGLYWVVLGLCWGNIGIMENKMSRSWAQGWRSDLSMGSEFDAWLIFENPPSQGSYNPCGNHFLFHYPNKNPKPDMPKGAQKPWVKEAPYIRIRDFKPILVHPEEWFWVFRV